MTNTNLKMSEDVEWEGLKIYKTFDYDKFKLMKGNRTVKNFQVNKLKASYKKGQIPVPLIVNQLYEIIDGQHRLEAIRQLKLPVPYTIIERLGIKEVQRLNTQHKNWVTNDYLECYVERGLQVYIKYNAQIHEKFNFDHVTKIALVKNRAILRGQGVQEQINIFKDGKFEATNKEFDHAIDVGIKIEAVERYFTGLELTRKQREGLWNAVRKLADYPSYNHSVMMDQLEKEGIRIPRLISRFKKLTTNEFLIILEDVYNNNRKGKPATFYHQLKQRLFKRDSI